MEKEKKKVPKLRFPEFTRDWEQRKFEQLYYRSSEKNDGSIGIDKNITVATMQYKTDVKVSSEDYLKTYYTFKVGDIAFEGHQSKDFRFGRFVENDIGDGIVSHIFAVFRPCTDYDLMYWKYAINNEVVMQKILSRSTKASTMMHDLVTSDFLREKILVPSLEEQHKIGEFLNNVDNLITLHQRKLDQMKNYKKGLLQKMFPKKGETVPEIRFPGFTGDWEQRKFGELCSIVTKQTGFDYTATIKNSLLTEETEETLPYLQTKNFAGVTINYNTDYYIPKAVAEKFPKINLDEKCLLFSIVGASVGNIGFFPGDKHCFLSGAICVSKLLNQDNAEYLYHYMCSECGQRQIRTCTKGGAQATITIEDIRDFEVLLPSENERKKIGAFLTSLDNTITLHQRELDKWKEFKKGLLQQMFV